MANDFNYTTDDILNMLTVAMHVDHADDTSNWVKYFRLWSDTFNDIQNKNDTIRQANDLDYCSGSMLDDEARNVGISRNGVNDDFLRFEIKSRLLARVCDGSMPMLYHFISTTLGCSLNEFKVQPMYEVDGTPNAIQINDIPEEYLANSRQSNLLREVIQDAVADGIRVLSINYQTYVSLHYWVGAMAQIEHEYTVGAQYRDLAYYTSAKTYVTGTAQIEHEYNINNDYRDLGYPVSGNEYHAEAVQIEHEYNIKNQKRS